jgi:uncharacterized lipoprotein YddW (UPF0748 family)
MARLPILSLVALAAARLAFAAPADAKADAVTPEVRALWVVRTSITSPEAIEKVVSDAKRAGINTLIVQVRGRGDAYYRSRWEPRSDALKEQPTSFDPLAEVLRQAHGANPGSRLAQHAPARQPRRAAAAA